MHSYLFYFQCWSVLTEISLNDKGLSRISYLFKSILMTQNNVAISHKYMSFSNLTASEDVQMIELQYLFLFKITVVFFVWGHQ